MSPQIKTTSVTLNDGTQVPVDYPDDPNDSFDESKLRSFDHFNSWLNTLQNSLSLQHTSPTHPFHTDPYQLRRINIQSYDIFGSPPNQRIGFLKLSATVRTASDKDFIPGTVFLRGPSVGVLIILLDADAAAAAGKEGKNDEDIYAHRHALLVVQPRVPGGSLGFVELPAGMIDGKENFAGRAAKEIEEETHLQIKAGELVSLNEIAAAAGAEEEAEKIPEGVFPSVGGCDEYLDLRVVEKKMSAKDISELRGKLAGLRDEGESITLKVVPLRDLWKEGRRDAKVLSALALWEGGKREGRL